MARAELVPLAEKVWRHCEGKQLSGRTVTLRLSSPISGKSPAARALPRLIGGRGFATMLADMFHVERGVSACSARPCRR
ncbi:hypothetical protein [Nitratireductor luteus]|uniref:hypothetical protein n=1 Tax=Nitratireductor luteus TaxID=2976980 RepID=UPI00223F1E45